MINSITITQVGVMVHAEHFIVTVRHSMKCSYFISSDNTSIISLEELMICSCSIKLNYLVITHQLPLCCFLL